MKSNFNPSLGRVVESKHSDDMKSKKRKLVSTELDWNFVNLGHLFERKKEKRILCDAFHRRLQPDSKSELLLVSGSSGTGKTVLALQLRSLAQERGGWFVMGKFDQMKRVEPYAQLIAAIDEFVLNVLDSHQLIIDLTRSSIMRAVGNEIGALMSMIPSLERLVGPLRSYTLKGADVEERFKKLFCAFVNSACTPSRPLVLVLDDLQWADRGSLELLEGLVANPDNHSLVVVGICRSNEVSLNHDFAVILRRLEDERDAVITNVEVGCFTLEATNELVASVLQQPEHLCFSVSATLHKKTSGNPLFLVQLLKALHENQVLIADVESDEWLWDEDKWKGHFEHTDTVVDLIVQRVQLLSSNCRLLLSTCACIGAETDKVLLSKVMNETFDLDGVLAECVSQGVIYKDKESPKYIFVHDRTQQASYSLINRDECSLFHLSIGRLLLKGLNENQLDEYVFVVVDQMSRGMVINDLDADEKTLLAKLCIRAGERSVDSNDFQTAMKYLKLGKRLVDLRRDWRDNYDLMLKLHNGLVQAACLTADYAALDEAMAYIDSHGRCFDDKLPGYSLQVYAMSAVLRLQDALDLGLKVLEHLGEKIPRKSNRVKLIANILNVKRMLRGKSDDDIMNLPDMTRNEKLAAMNILNILAVVCYWGNKDLFPFIVLRMMKLTLQHGLSAISSMAFCTFAVITIATGDINGGYRYSCLGLSILEDRYTIVKHDWMSRVHTVHYGMIASWYVPLRETMEKLYLSYKSGKGYGDREFTMVALFMYCRGTLVSGRPLLEQEYTVRSAVSEMHEISQDSLAELTSLTLEAILLLTGRNDDPIVTNGILLNLEHGSPKLQEVHSTAGLDFEFFTSAAKMTCIIVFYHAGEMETAVRIVSLTKDAIKVSPGGVANNAHAFYSSLACLTMIRQSPSLSRSARRELLSHSNHHLKYLKKRNKYCPANIKHKLLLLEAEYDALDGKIQQALTKYAKAQDLAGREGALDVQALACERASLTLHESRGNESQKFFLLELAIDLYEKWGAVGKKIRMEQLLEDWVSVTQDAQLSC